MGYVSKSFIKQLEMCVSVACDSKNPTLTETKKLNNFRLWNFARRFCVVSFIHYIILILTKILPLSVR